MEAQDPLAELADIHLPGTSIDPWPPAIGWWLLAGIVLAICISLVLLYLHHRRQQRHLAAALRELQKTYRSYKKQAGMPDQFTDYANNYLQGVNAILKRVALHHYGDQDPALGSLHGKAWLAFLDQKGQGNNFRNGPGNILSEGQYQANPEFNARTIYDLAENWIRKQYSSHTIRTPKHKLEAGTA